jgi:hypothetical protein
MTPGDLYRTCRASAYRLEVRQHYIVSGDAERQRAFRAGEPLPPPRQDKQDDLRLVAGLRQAGKQIGRVHVVSWPLSDYVRYELAVYSENVAAGEDVAIADVSAHPDLARLDTDFAIFDGETDEPSVILFDYSPEGRLLGYGLTRDPGVVNRCLRQYQLAREHAVALQEFTAAHQQ